jgi:hypothetical protein
MNQDFVDLLRAFSGATGRSRDLADIEDLD